MGEWLQINIGKEGEAALSQWWELGSMPANLCNRIRFLSAQRMISSKSNLLFWFWVNRKINHHRRILYGLRDRVLLFSAFTSTRAAKSVVSSPVWMILVTFFFFSFLDGIRLLTFHTPIGWQWGSMLHCLIVVLNFSVNYKASWLCIY